MTCGGHSSWEGAGHQGLRAPTSSVPRKFLNPPWPPGAMASPRFGGRAGRACPHLLTSSPHQDKDITVSIPVMPQIPGPFITARGWEGCNYRSHRLSSAHCFRQEHTPPTPGPLPGAAGRRVGAPRFVSRASQTRSWDPNRSAAAPGGRREAQVGSQRRRAPPSRRQARGKAGFRLWARHRPGAGRARLGHSGRLAPATGDVRTETASGPAEHLPVPAAHGWLSPHPRDHRRSWEGLRAQHPRRDSGRAEGRAHRGRP